MPSIRIPCLALFALLCLSTPLVHAQLVFGAQVNGPNGPAAGLFQLRNGSVTPINTGLPQHQFPSLSANGRWVVFSSPDPAQPHETSWDLFAFDRVTGTSRRVHDNVTQEDNGSFLFFAPLFSGTSADGGLVAFANQVSNTTSQGSNSFRHLRVNRLSDGQLASSVEFGNGSALDFYQSEFLGIAWWPFGPLFATSGYVPVVTNTGRPTWAAGIVLYGPDSTGQFVRQGALTIPVVTDLQPVGITVDTHAYPAFSPNGARMAYFIIHYPSPLLDQPASARLMVVNTNGQGSPQQLASFSPGQMPLGLTWSTNGAQLIFSLGQQSSSGGQFPPTANPGSAVLRQINAGGGSVTAIAGAPNGYFPGAMPAMILRHGFE